MRLFSNLVLALSFTLSFISPSLAHAHEGRRHHVHRHDLARRDPGEVELYKRFDNARLTFYAVGLGACGQTNQPSDFIVALNSIQYNGGQYCFQMITITVNGKTAQAQIMDECPGCPDFGLDLSTGLFDFFADPSVGVLYGSWDFDSGGSSPAPSPSPSPSPTPTPTPTPVYTPTTTSLPPTTTSSPPMSSSSSTSSASLSSSAVSSNGSSTASVPIASVSVTTGMVQGANSSILSDTNLSIVYIGHFLSVCIGSQ